MIVFFPDVFAAAHDFKTEWVVVKGIKDFANERQSSSEEWEQIACVMAASVVANILSDVVIFQDWPHFNAGVTSFLSLSFLSGTDVILICIFLFVSQINITFSVKVQE